MAAVEQRDFSGGEITAALHGRNDFAKYSSSLRKMRNFFPTKHGSAVNRPGTVFVAGTKNNGIVRLIPFIFSDTQTYILEFGNLYIRFHTLGATVVTAPDTPYEVVTTYTDAQVGRIKFAQLGDVLTLCHPDHPPRELKRTGHTNWTLTDVNFDRPASPIHADSHVESPISLPDANNPARLWYWDVTELRQDERGVVWESAPRRITKIGHTQWGQWQNYLPYANGAEVTNGGTYYRAIQAVPAGTAITNVAYWQVEGAPVGQNPAPHTYIDMVPIPLSVTKPQTIWLTGHVHDSGLMSGDPTFIGYRVYRGRGGLSGWLTDTKNKYFIDIGEEPNYAVTPPEGRNPFKIYNSVGALIRTEYPAAVSFFEQRRIFARTNERPDFIFCSATNDFANFDRHLPLQAADGMEFEIAGRKRQEIRSIVGLSKLVGLTGNGEWLTGGARGEPLAPDSLDARMQSERGATWLDPIVYGDGILLYVQQKGTVVREMSYSNERENATGADLSYPAEHFFRSSTIVSWAYAEDPHSLLYAVRSDGQFLTLTYQPDYKIFGWALHKTGQHALPANWDSALDVCAVPEGTEDAVYFVVKRYIDNMWKYYIERMATRNVVDVKEGIFLDCTKTFRNVAPGTTQYDVSHLKGRGCSALADGYVFHNLAVSPAGTVTIPDDDGTGWGVVHIGLPYTPEMETLDLAAEPTRQKIVKEIWVRMDASRGLWVGESLEEPTRMVEWQQRDVKDSYDVIGSFTGKQQIVVSGRWGVGGRAAIQQRDPLPVTITSVIREVSLGGPER